MRLGMARDCLVHRVVEDLGHEMMERALVGAADIHAGAAADRLEALEDLDVLGGVVLLGPAAARRGGKQVVAQGRFGDLAAGSGGQSCGLPRNRGTGISGGSDRLYSNIWYDKESQSESRPCRLAARRARC